VLCVCAVVSSTGDCVVEGGSTQHNMILQVRCGCDLGGRGDDVDLIFPSSTNVNAIKGTVAPDLIGLKVV
jgi:hypothetical protein